MASTSSPLATLAMRSISTFCGRSVWSAELDGVLGDVHPVVGDALEVGRHFDHRRNFAQLARDRLLAPDQFDAMRFDASPKLVHGVVAGNHARAGARVAMFERVDGASNGVGSQRAQSDDVQARRFERLVIRGAHVLQVLLPCRGIATNGGSPAVRSALVYVKGGIPATQRRPLRLYQTIARPYQTIRKKERSVSEIRTVGVCGAGLMGNGIAQTCASAGFNVVLMEVAPEPLERGMKSIAGSLAKFVEKGKLAPADRDATLARIVATTDVAGMKDCDLVIEAIVENVAVKTELFQKLDALLAPHAILCTNTSSLCVIELAAKTKRPNRVAGLHFFNPVPLMKLVEVVKTIATTQDVVDDLFAFAIQLGKSRSSRKTRPASS